MGGKVSRTGVETRFRQALEGVGGQVGGIVTVSGEAGSGRTRLISGALSDNPRRSLTVVRAWGGIRDGGTPLTVSAQIATGLQSCRPAAGRVRARTLTDTVTRAGLGPADVDEFEGIVRLVADLEDLVVVVDDADLADAQSGPLVERLILLTRSTPLLLVLVWGPDPQVSTALGPAANLVRSSPNRVHIALPPLPADDVTALVADVADLDDEQVRTVVTVAAGNPLIAREAAFYTATGQAGSHARQAIAVLAARTRALGDDARVLAALALLGRPASVVLLAATCDLDSGHLRQRVLPGATTAGLVERLGRIGQYRLTHPWVAEAVLGTLPSETLRDLHLGIARAVTSQGNSTSPRGTEAARHLVASGVGGPDTAEACLYAAQREERDGAFGVAGELAVAGLGAGDVAEELAVAGLEAGDVAPIGPALQVGLMRVLGRCRGRARRADAARELLERAVALARAKLDSQVFAEAVADLAEADMGFCGPRERLAGLLRAALAAAEDPPLRARLLAYLACCVYFEDVAEGRRLAEQAKDLALSTDDRVAIAVSGDVWAFTCSGEQGGALVSGTWDRLHERVPVHSLGATSLTLGPAILRADRPALDYELARLAEAPPIVAQARLDGLLDVVRLGRAAMDADHDEIRRLRARLQTTPSLDVRLLAAVAELLWQMQSGEVGETSESVIAAMPTPDLARIFLGGLACIRVYLREPGALEALVHVADVRSRLLTQPPDLAFDGAMALVAFTGGIIGDVELCRLALDALDYATNQFLAIAMVVPVGPADFFVAWAHRGLGDLDAALAANRRAEASSRRMEAPVWVAHCALQRAELLAQTDPEAAAEAARSAAAQARRLGLESLARRAEAALVDTPPPQPVTGSREQRILALAADGLTNEQIARELYLSVSTVERHFTQIYRSLGVRNRAEALAATKARRSSATNSTAADKDVRRPPA